MTEIEWMEEFGNRILELLDDNAMTQRDLADDIGVSDASISNYIHGRNIPNVFTLVKMIYALNTTADELIDFGDTID